MIEDRFIVGIGKNKFDVIAGHKLNAEPLSRAAADRLAHEPNAPTDQRGGLALGSVLKRVGPKTTMQSA
jgi:hypothetical protein